MDGSFLGETKGKKLFFFSNFGHCIVSVVSEILTHSTPSRIKELHDCLWNPKKKKRNKQINK